MTGVTGHVDVRVGAKGWAALRMSGDIDTATRAACLDAARTAVLSGATSVLVDLRAVTFLDSTGMSAIATLLRGAANGAAQGESGVPAVFLLDPQPVVLTSLKVTGMLDAVRLLDVSDLPADACELL